MIPAPWVRRLAMGGLVVYAAVVVFVLLSPLSYGGFVSTIGNVLRYRVGLTGFGYGWIEFIANILMFLPLGLLLTLVFRHLWRGVALALALSIGAELAQMVIPARLASPRDVLANALGAVIGAGVALLMMRWTSRSPTAVPADGGDLPGRSSRTRPEVTPRRDVPSAD